MLNKLPTKPLEDKTDQPAPKKRPGCLLFEERSVLPTIQEETETQKKSQEPDIETGIVRNGCGFPYGY